jgi:hypothetical protein
MPNFYRRKVVIKNVFTNHFKPTYSIIYLLIDSKKKDT